MRKAAIRVLTDPKVVWALTAVLVARLIILGIVNTDRPDAASFLAAGQMWLHNPGHLYDSVAAYISRNHLGPAEGLVGPPGGAVLAAPFSLLPSPWSTIGWTLLDCAAVLGGLLILDHHLRLRGVQRAWFWFVAAIFPPLFGEVLASQISGDIFFLGCAAMVLMGSRPAIAGLLAAVGTGLKVYPASILLGSGPARWVRSLAGFAAGGVLTTVISFGPMGIASPYNYLRQVLVPLLNTPIPDCQVVSVSSFWDRLVGGVAYPTLVGGHESWLQVGLSLPALAKVLSALTLLSIVGLALWTMWRSRWDPLQSTAIAFALGGVLPSELRTYQILPLLPLLLIALTRAMQRRSARTLVFLALGLVGLVEQPCDLSFPNLWTVAVVWLFAISACSVSLD